MLFKLPDGVKVDLPIEFMDVKDSLFVPTLKSQSTIGRLHTQAKRSGYELRCEKAIFDGYLGVLFWRVK